MDNKKQLYKFLPHTADIKFQAFGNSIEECFKNAGYAVVNIICRQKIKPAIKKKIKVDGKDLENLLYNFLEEFLFLLDSENFLLGKIKKIKITEKDKKFSLITEISGDKAKNYKTELDVKAITYNEMFVKFDDKKKEWVSQVVADV